MFKLAASLKQYEWLDSYRQFFDHEESNREPNLSRVTRIVHKKQFGSQSPVLNHDFTVLLSSSAH